MTAPRIKVALFGPPGQGSFNESGYDGAMRARAAGHSLEVHWTPRWRQKAVPRRCAPYASNPPTCWSLMVARAMNR